MSSPVVHFAGPVVYAEFGKLLRQRCAWCGAELVNVNLDRVAVQVEPGEEPRPYPTWPETHWIRVEGNCSADIGQFADAPPADSCMAFDVAVIA